MFLDRFVLPTGVEEEFLWQIQAEKNGGRFGYVDNSYPCGIFPRKELSEITFAKITIFYGGNGSGKSTLLNLIARKLELNRIAPFNSGEMFDLYADACDYELGYDEEGFRHRIPDGSRIITSDDVFDYMLAVRTNNQEIEELKEAAKGEYASLKYGKTVQMRGMEDYEQLRSQVLARSPSVSRRKYLQKTLGEEVLLNSNGETALAYFEQKLKNDTLYCLDEPENSLSAKMQQKLSKTLSELAHYCGCQLVIATHSPFLLAMDGARIYDLDRTPVPISKWWELENVKTYAAFFKQHADLF